LGWSYSVSWSAYLAIALSIASRDMPSLISGLFAIDFSVTCGTVL